MTSDARGGMWTYVMSLAAEMAKENVQVIVATLGSEPSPAQRQEVAALPNVRLYEGGYRLEWMDGDRDDSAEAARWLLSIEARTKPDLIHQNHLAIGGPAWSAPVLLAPHCCSVMRAQQLGLVLPDRNRALPRTSPSHNHIK